MNEPEAEVGAGVGTTPGDHAPRRSQAPSIPNATFRTRRDNITNDDVVRTPHGRFQYVRAIRGRDDTDTNTNTPKTYAGTLASSPSFSSFMSSHRRAFMDDETLSRDAPPASPATGCTGEYATDGQGYTAATCTSSTNSRDRFFAVGSSAPTVPHSTLVVVHVL